jgi:photosystem II stability/assembly factor-like uncharacterized protein
MTWSAQKSGTLARLSGVFVDRERGWIVGSNGTVLLTEDGGARWQRAAVESRETLRDVFFLDAQRGRALGEYSIFNRPANNIPKEHSFLMASDDGGRSWSSALPLAQPASSGDEPRNYHRDGLLRLKFVDDHTGWACGETGVILVTRDGGRTWLAQRSPVRKLLYDLAAIDDKRAWIVGAGGVALRTVDGGQNWNEQPSGATQTLRSVFFLDARRGWAVGSGGTILATTNGGNRWREMSSGVKDDLNTVFFTSAAEGWAAGEHGALLHTRDGGMTWEAVKLKTNANLARLSLTRLFFVAPDCGWVVGSGGAIFKYQPGESSDR